MADFYEQWREADREAHAIERQIRVLGRHSKDEEVSPGDLERARQRRAEADHLFAAAMRDMNAKVNSALAASRNAGGTRSLR
jgi:hypothetical protein